MTWRGYVSKGTRPPSKLGEGGVAYAPERGRGVVSPIWVGGAWSGSARRASGPARAGVRGHGGVGCGGKHCLKRVSYGRRGIAEDLAWPGRRLGEPSPWA